MTSHSVGSYHSICQLYTRYLLVSAIMQRLKNLSVEECNKWAQRCNKSLNGLEPKLWNY